MMPEEHIVTAKQLGIYIKHARKAAALTQLEAAGLCGVSVPFFNAVENGKGTAQIDKVLHVCHQLGIHVTAHMPGEMT